MRKLLLIAALGAVAMLPAGAAGGRVQSPTKEPKYETTVKITKVDVAGKRGTSYFHGVVKSEKPGCESGREVYLTRKSGGKTASTGDDDSANSHGRFKITVLAFPPGKYRANTLAIGIGGPTGGYTCKAGKSEAYNREL